MYKKYSSYQFILTISLFVFYLFFDIPVRAQIRPDNSLRNKTLINRSGNTTSIRGGERRRSNLFHSFKDFSIRNGQKANFMPAGNIKNIFTRITGKRATNINGILRVSGKSNLFLLNSNGINILENAKLHSLGSITLSTSPRLNFEDFGYFSTSNLSSNRFSSSNNFSFSLEGAKPIRVINSGNSIIFNDLQRPQVSSLSPSPSDSLLFKSRNDLNIIGSSIHLNGGVVNSNGDINVISGTKGSVDFRQSKFNSRQDRFQGGNIRLFSRASIESSGSPAGDIRLYGENLDLGSSSIILSSNFGGQAGDISIDAEHINLVGIDNPLDSGFIDFSPESLSTGVLYSGIVSQNFNGKGADIRISTENLDLRDFSTIVSINAGPGISGDILIVADSTVIDGTPPTSFFLSSITTTQLQGLSGRISLVGSNLRLCCGAQLNSQNATFNPSMALPGGNIDIDVNNITVEGRAIVSSDLLANSANPSGVVSSNIATVAFVNGNSGDISVKAKGIKLNESGTISSLTSGLGRAGDLKISAKRIDIVGDPASNILENQSKILSSAITVSPFIQELFQLSRNNISGDSGNLDITSDFIDISRQGLIGVLNEGAGDAGEVSVKANSLRLDDAIISASTNSGNGGNIFIGSDILSLTDASILTNAQGQGIGGNIKIRSGLLSLINKGQILANAQQNRAGNITIFSDASVLSNNSVIAASSLLGPQFNGNIDLNIQNQQVIAQQRIAPTLKPGISVADACSSGKNSLTEVPRNLHDEFITDPDLIKAANLKRRQEAAEQFKFRDESGKVHTFRRWLGVEKLEGNKARFIYSSNQSDKLNKMLSFLDSKCKSFTS